MIEAARGSLAARPELAQFVKFCLVGLSSFIIDIGLMNLLHFRFGVPLIPSKTVSFMAGVSNGFLWNSRWTFRHNRTKTSVQFPKFFATNLVGLALNLSIMTGAILIAMRLGVMHVGRPAGEIVRLLVSGQGRTEFNPMTVNLATIVATVVTTAWNFTAAKFITFK